MRSRRRAGRQPVGRLPREDARLYRKSGGAESRLAYLGHVLLEHRSGLIVDVTVTPVALTMIERHGGSQRITVAAANIVRMRRLLPAMA